MSVCRQIAMLFFALLSSLTLPVSSLASDAKNECETLLTGHGQHPAQQKLFGKLNQNEGRISAQRGKQDVFRITAGLQRAHLTGEVAVSKAKNSALKLVVAAALKAGKTTFYDLPDLRDMETLFALMRKIGIKVEQSGRRTIVDATTIETNRLDCELVSSMRASILFFGTLLARTGGSMVSMPGGCDIGARRVDFHVAGTRAKGIDVFHLDESKGHLAASKPDKLPADVTYRQPFASVGAMENLIISNVLGNQTFTLHNSALEPEIDDLLNFLKTMGADIQVNGRTTVVRGVQQHELKEISYTPIGDRIEAISYIVAALYKGSRLKVTGFNPAHISETLQVLRRMGARFIIGKDHVVVMPHKGLRATSFSTNPSPGVPTDAQSLILWLMTKASGKSEVIENVYEGRIRGFAQFLNSMGADIRFYGNKAVIYGRPNQWLQAKNGTCLDLRAGMAALLALTNASGGAELSGIDKIDRGYAFVEEKLNRLGCRFHRRGPGSSKK